RPGPGRPGRSAGSAGRSRRSQDRRARHRAPREAAIEFEGRLPVPNKRPSVKNEKQYEALKDKGMSKQRAARIANSPRASKRGGQKSHSTSSSGSAKQGGTTAQKKAAGRKGGKASARSR